VLRIISPEGEKWMPESRDIVDYLREVKAGVYPGVSAQQPVPGL